MYNFIEIVAKLFDNQIASHDPPVTANSSTCQEYICEMSWLHAIMKIFSAGYTPVVTTKTVITSHFTETERCLLSLFLVLLLIAKHLVIFRSCHCQIQS